VGIKDRQECGDDVPLTCGYVGENNRRIRRMQREQAHVLGRTAAARPGALFLGI